MSITPTEIRTLAISCSLLLLGLLALFDRRTRNASLASLLLVGGVCGVVWCVGRVHRRRIVKREQEARVARQALLREQRQSRTLARRQVRRSRRESQDAARKRLLEKQHAERQIQQQSTDQQRLQQASRAVAIDAEARRLSGLTSSDLSREVAHIFTHRGFQVESADPGSPFDLLLTDPDNSLIVARCVPRERQAIATDIRAIETWRREARAERSYLISLAGFTPEAVASSRSLPCTLVEAHLLAHWQFA